MNGKQAGKPGTLSNVDTGKVLPESWCTFGDFLLFVAAFLFSLSVQWGCPELPEAMPLFSLTLRAAFHSRFPHFTHCPVNDVSGSYV